VNDIKRLFLFFILLATSSALFAQPDCNDDAEEPSLSCADFGQPLCDITAITGFCGRLPRVNALEGDGWCGPRSVISNGSVFRFFVNSDNTTIRVYWEDCGLFRSPGVQAAIYEGCTNTFTNPIICEDACESFVNPVEFSFGAVAGQDYTLIIDGCFSNQCRYIVEIITDNPDPIVRVADWTSDDRINGIGFNGETLCPDILSSCLTYDVPFLLSANAYNWYIDGQLTAETTQPSWSPDLSTLNTDLAVLCVEGFNQCDSSLQLCDTLRFASTTMIVDTCICPESLIDFTYRGDTFSGEVVDQMYVDVDNCGCRDTTLFSLEIIEGDTLPLTVAVCEEQLLEGFQLDNQLNDEIFNTPGAQGIIALNNQSIYNCLEDAALSCTDFVSLSILPINIAGSIPDDTISCAASEEIIDISSLSFLPTRDSLIIDVTWMDSSGGFLSSEEILNVDASGEYVVEINYEHINPRYSSLSCSFIDTFSVELINEITDLSLTLDVQDESCAGLNNGRVRVTHNTFDSLSVSLNENDFLQTSEIDSLVPGDYDITVRLPNGCIIQESFTIGAGETSRYSIVASDTVFFAGDPVQFSIVGDSATSLVSTIWSESFVRNCNPCKTISVNPKISKTIAVEIEDNLGCTDVAFLDITVLDEDAVFIPNVFSPNAIENINQTFRIFTDERVRQLSQVYIYDRWGGLVAHQENLTSGDTAWDGTLSGAPLSAGVYIYIVTAEFINGEQRQYQGDITLLL